MNKNNIEKIIAHFGSMAEMARALNVTKTAIKKWQLGENRITAERAIEFEKATEGRFKRQDFRPDLFE